MREHTLVVYLVLIQTVVGAAPRSVPAAVEQIAETSGSQRWASSNQRSLLRHRHGGRRNFTVPSTWDVSRRDRPYTWPTDRPNRWISTLIIASLAGGTGHLCRSPDWRGALPKFLADANPDAVTLVWHNARIYHSTARCELCTPLGLVGHAFNCDDWMAEQERTADAILMVGQGPGTCARNSIDCVDDSPGSPNPLLRKNFTAMYTVLSKPWVRDDTWVSHIPVSNDLALQTNVFNFSRVVLDHDFLKPPDQQNAALLSGCARRPKNDILIYPARYSSTDHKGQQAFLLGVDPRDLKGYTIKFYGDNVYNVPELHLQEIALRRNISIEVHGKVPQPELLQELCSAKGVVLFSKYDANPRVAYEGLPAGNPVYISSTIEIPVLLRDQPFVFGDHSLEVAEFQLRMRSFHQFMKAIKGADRSYYEAIARRSMKLLDHNAVYGSVCENLGLCMFRKEPGTLRL